MSTSLQSLNFASTVLRRRFSVVSTRDFKDPIKTLFRVIFYWINMDDMIYEESNILIIENLKQKKTTTIPTW